MLCMYEHFDKMPDPFIDEKVKKIHARIQKVRKVPKMFQQKLQT